MLYVQTTNLQVGNKQRIKIIHTWRWRHLCRVDLVFDIVSLVKDIDAGPEIHVVLRGAVRQSKSLNSTTCVWIALATLYDRVRLSRGPGNDIYCIAPMRTIHVCHCKLWSSWLCHMTLSHDIVSWHCHMTLSHWPISQAKLFWNILGNRKSQRKAAK